MNYWMRTRGLKIGGEGEEMGKTKLETQRIIY